MSEALKIRPYARLITMLGDQLIKNEAIALIEIIKNSYDADASQVTVRFEGFNSDFTNSKESRIIIEDDGIGMNKDILVNHWLNPATPIKLNSKSQNDRTPKGRIVQGEKGIGRFSVFKLGKKIKIITRRQNDNCKVSLNEGETEEFILNYDFSTFDDNFSSLDNDDTNLFLDDLTVILDTREPQVFIENNSSRKEQSVRRKSHGTIIEISDLKTKWNRSKINSVISAAGKMQPVFSNKQNADFMVSFYLNEDLLSSHDDYKDKLDYLLNEKSVIRVTEGSFDCEKKEYVFRLNERPVRLGFEDAALTGMRQFEYFRTLEDRRESLECGSYNFEFYFFDFNNHLESQSKYSLDKTEKEIIKEHRVYLYRDGVRVMPYGDSDDDWLGIDIDRGTIRANMYLSNDQVVGCINISQKNNPNLIDKTNREGLIESGHAVADFIHSIKLFLGYIRGTEYAQYIIEKGKKVEIERLKKGAPLDLIQDATDLLKDNKDAIELLKKIENSYTKEREVFEERNHRLENLAAVGLSIDMASHDMMLFMKRATEGIDMLINDFVDPTFVIEKAGVADRLISIKGNLSMVETQLHNIQPLFPSTKRRTKKINVNEIVEKIYSIYKHQLNQHNIQVEIRSSELPLIVKTTDAVLLQVFINLFDNSLYWLSHYNNKDKRIVVKIDGDDNRVIFSDNGPGIRNEDRNYIFEAFYSGKGEEGRGLGLYIARQLLDRYDYSIDLAEISADKLLDGANFVIEFVQEKTGE